MNEFYDTVKARDALERYAQESMEINEFHLCAITKNRSMQSVSLEDDGSGYVWRLLTQAKEEAETEEVVFTVNGIISGMDLPPLYRVPKSMSDKPVILSQKLTISGLGASTFAESMSALREVSLTAEREFKQGTLEQWTPTTFNGFEAMESTNRYFRRVHEGDNDVALTFPKEVDPNGVLQQLS
ncbi:uncharacterized protein ARMOST_12222 [Armillaria ostoyae]|uniref:Uncharacterized protein n=1 Tax=Armillaria ostoyae TaxID=47428 RepID=A0A284RJA4_ARMOS|nr:uncharacterized protein ARMOST_12222 [Armillaria ostoyae]